MSGVVTIAEVHKQLRSVGIFEPKDAELFEPAWNPANPAQSSEMRTLLAVPAESCREDLRLLVEAEAGSALIAECTEGETAEAVENFRPHVVFLDLTLSDAWNFECAHDGQCEGGPIVIAVAPGEQYAARAFALRAVDFLVRPFQRNSVRRALERASHELRNARNSRLTGKVMSLLNNSRPPAEGDQLAFKSKGRIVLLDLGEIDWIAAEANYVQLYAGTETYLMRESIGRLEKRLDPRCFLRVHRSTIVNRHKIRELQPCNRGEYIAVLKNGKRLSCGRAYRSQLERFLSSCF